MHPLYPILLNDIKIDITQMVETGHDSDHLLAELHDVEVTGSFDALAKFQVDLWQRPSPASFCYEEPDDWKTISASFPESSSQAFFKGSDDELADRIHAAWLGRCIGCQLGKPLEGTLWPAKIKEVLEFVDSWPLNDYMNPVPSHYRPDQLPDCNFFERNKVWHNAFCRGHFDHVAPDDDIHYTIVSQLILERHGLDFTPEQALEVLKEQLPISWLWAAGRSMYRSSIFGLLPPRTAIMGNPCRQSLGAQIRCDPFGWAAPGNPALAAKMAYRDAANSQVRNGIYSAIFFAALMADVMANGNPTLAIKNALPYVPPKSRFAEMVRFMLDLCAANDDWEVVSKIMIERYYVEAAKFNHSIPNAANVILGLLKGEGDFTRTLGITVMAGLDTDCTGATVGSIMGCAYGMEAIPKYFSEPLNDCIKLEMRDFREERISVMAQRMFSVVRENVRRK